MAIKIKKDKIGNIESSLNKKDPKLVVDNDDYNSVSLYFDGFYDPKRLNKFIRDCERKIRSSEQYSRYIGNLRNDKGLHYCAVRGKITDEDASIEFHHYPFTLYDIVYLVIVKNVMEDIKFTSFNIIVEVLDLHSKNMIGLVPLSITEHQLVHDGVRAIPITSVFGKLNEFVEKFSPYMDDDMIEKYNQLIEI